MYLDLESRRKIVELFQEGKTHRDIAKHFDISISTVNYWVNRHGSLETKKKPGRKQKLDRHKQKSILLMSERNPFMPASQILHELNLNVCSQTIRNRLREKGLRNYAAVKKEILKPMHKQKRLEFALRYQNWSSDKWKQVCFTDEKRFSTFGHGFTRVWRYPKDKYLAKNITAVGKSGRKTIPVWGCIGANINNIHYIRANNLNKTYYINNVLSLYLPDVVEDDFYFVHDASPVHKAKDVTEWLRQNNIQVLPFPAKSPDLNPIENIWAEMERKTCDRNIQNENELWDKIEDMFFEVTSKHVNALLESMPSRLQQVIQAQGGWTKY